MWVTIEPGDMLMSRILFWFRTRDPDPEDRWVRGYLDEWHVEPKRTWSEEQEGMPYEVLQFGECYLRPHVPALKALLRQGLAAHAVEEAVAGVPECAVLLDDIDPAERPAAIWALAGRATELDAVQEAEDGGIAVAREFVSEQLLKLNATALGSP